MTDPRRFSKDVMRTKPRCPSDAQARLIARLWSTGTTVNVATANYWDQTVNACIKYKWLCSTGEFGEYPSGAPFETFGLSPNALGALEDYLRTERYRRVAS